jgi:hypothetical protein
MKRNHVHRYVAHLVTLNEGQGHSMPPLEAEVVAAETFLATLKPDEQVCISLAENFFKSEVILLFTDLALPRAVSASEARAVFCFLGKRSEAPVGVDT